MIAVFAVTLFLYSWLIQSGRIEAKNPPTNQAADPTASLVTPELDSLSLKVRPINQTEESQLRDCFPWGVYYLQNLEYRPQAVICRGHLRSKPDVAYKTIRENIEAKFGDRFLILFQDGFNGHPFFALVPNPHPQPRQRQPFDRPRNSELSTRPILAFSLMFATLLTTTVGGAKIAGFNPDAISSDPNLLLNGLPYALAIMAILGIHEMGHYLMARHYKLRVSLPYFIPVPYVQDMGYFLGTFGAFVQLRSLAPNRKSLFDVAIAGPVAGFLVTLPLLIWGLAHSSIVPLADKAGIFNFNSLNPSFSLLLTLLSKLALGSQLTATTAIKLHPIAVAGYIGLIVTAFNLMPVGQLDGGRIVHAIFGHRQAANIGQISRFLLLGTSLTPWLIKVTLIPPEYLFWAIFLFLIPIYDEPALNDVTELNNQRDFSGLMALGLLLLIILPAPLFLIG